MSRRPLIHAGIFVLLFGVVALVGLFPVTTGNATDNPRLNIGQLGFPGLAASAPAAMLAEIQAGPVTLTVVAPGVSEEALLGVNDVTGDEVERNQLAVEAAAVLSNDASTAAVGRVSMYLNYVVQEGDTITAIATAHGLGRDYITWNNVDLSDPNRLSPGDQIIVPWEEGIVHAVRTDETLSAIARRYDADIQDILDFGANNVPNPSLLQADKLIFVPGGRIVPAAVSIRPGPTADTLQQSGDWFWPASGVITSEFTAWHPLGIDIAVLSGTEIVATRPGVVRFIGGDPWNGYGLHLKIDHGNGWESTYGHLNQILVESNTVVKQGDVIGLSGNTGRSTGPHLHFEIRIWNVPQNPIPLLNQVVN
jgi:hypothetical protein